MGREEQIEEIAKERDEIKNKFCKAFRQICR